MPAVTLPVMLFAAGFGTRMGQLTANRPKPMIEVAGKPLIDHALDQVTTYGADRIVVNLHYLPDQIERHLAGRGILMSLENPVILETGGGLRAALPILGAGPVFTMNTDAVWRGPNPLCHLAAQWHPETMDALLLCIPKSRAVGHDGTGDFVISDDGQATRGPGAIYSGLQIIKTDRLPDIDESAFSLNLLWDRILAEGRLFAVTYPGKWCDVGHPEGIALAEAVLGTSDV
ncbi:MAG: nucleotidyltransferase family protein [Roseovarius sp.]|nr:nucleotidyltransferase family protein [Roseovarius sp.]